MDKPDRDHAANGDGRQRSDTRPRPVPSSRLSRLGRFGGLTVGVAGAVAAESARRLATGRPARLSDVLLTPSNALRIADELSRLRGAAMKIGQLISMEAGDFVPAELAEILSRLRDSATHMPPHQLRATLDREWGRSWLSNFQRFDPRPIAAASIGQVHRAIDRQGRELAIKVQYPGVRESIDSDVDNVASLLSISGLLPRDSDIRPFLDEAKRQLREEADYLAEAERLERFGRLLANDPSFVTPELIPELTTSRVLTMSYVSGLPIETLASASQSTRNAVMSRLISLVFRELFDFRFMQTDPNFANFRYDESSGRIVLLDFGAARDLSPDLCERYRHLISAARNSDRLLMRETALEIGLVSEGFFAANADRIHQAFDVVSEPLRRAGAYDFGTSDIPDRMRDLGMDFDMRDLLSQAPPPDAAFIHRKFGGIFLLARTLKARVDVDGTVARFCANTASDPAPLTPAKC